MIAVDPTITHTHQPAASSGETGTRASFISHNQMREHQHNGLATPLSRIITDFVTYNQQWWIADHHGWHLIDDEHLINKLNNHSTWANGGLYLGGCGTVVRKH